jgi:DNA mismatch repair protein MutS
MMARTKKREAPAMGEDEAVQRADNELPPAGAATAMPDAPAAGITPSMAQFLEIKAANPDCVLWYRMGDFYELFFQDAVVVSEALGIVLTKRGKHLGEDIPMCGVPIHRADEYLQRLIRKGFRIAVCEQLEDPAEARKRGSKAVVRRDVVRLVTPGTLTEDSLLDARARNFLTALFEAPRSERATALYALASLDISTGEFEVGEVGAADLAGEIARLAPGEIIAADVVLGAAALKVALGVAGSALTPIAGQSFDSLAGERLLKLHLGAADLSGFGTFSRPELAAIGALLKYVELTQIGKRPLVRPPRRTGPAGTLVIDAATRASLELLRATSGERSSSLVGAIDRTVSGPGARLLAARIASPERDLDVITARQDGVQFLLEKERARQDVREALRSAPDVARAVSRLALQRGGPRDLAAVRGALAAGRTIADALTKGGGSIGLPRLIADLLPALAPSGVDLEQELAAALVEEPPHLRRDGGFVRTGYSADIDAARRLGNESRGVIAALETRYVEATANRTLKIRHNNILGYYIEVSAATAKALLEPPHAALFRHRQSMASAVRFVTDELVELDGAIATAGVRALALEQEVFNRLADRVAAAERALGALAEALAEVDVVAGLAEIAAEQDYVRPILDAGTAFEVRGGRHPVVEQALRQSRAGAFVENDCVLGRAAPERPPGFDDAADRRIWLVTGPNMAGKSTFLRQNALIVVLAQAGSFVPARQARIGLVDRLFSRVGAADDLARGRSTFMVEMVETAAILHQATNRSLVILDEIGRGTATFDGLSIAWATVEYLHDVTGCRALFATHYHEMTALAGKLAEVSNVTVAVREWQDEIVFLHKVKPGAADRSYGIQVAKLAGLPRAVIERAGEVLSVLEKADGAGKAVAALDDLPLFAAARPKGGLVSAPAGQIETALDAINPDDLTPKAALETLYRLKALRVPR